MTTCVDPHPVCVDLCIVLCRFVYRFVSISMSFCMLIRGLFVFGFQWIWIRSE